MPYCVKCGAQLKGSDKFCVICSAAAPRLISEEYKVSGKEVVDRVGELLY